MRLGLFRCGGGRRNLTGRGNRIGHRQAEFFKLLHDNRLGAALRRREVHRERLRPAAALRCVQAGSGRRENGVDRNRRRPAAGRHDSDIAAGLAVVEPRHVDPAADDELPQLGFPLEHRLDDRVEQRDKLGRERQLAVGRFPAGGHHQQTAVAAPGRQPRRCAGVEPCEHIDALVGQVLQLAIFPKMQLREVAEPRVAEHRQNRVVKLERLQQCVVARRDVADDHAVRTKPLSEVCGLARRLHNNHRSRAALDRLTKCLGQRAGDGIADDKQVGLRQRAGRLATDGLHLKIDRTRFLEGAFEIKQRALGVVGLVLADVHDAHRLLPVLREVKLVVELSRVAADGQALEGLPGPFARQLDHPAAARRDVHLLAESLAGGGVCQKLQLVADAVG